MNDKAASPVFNVEDRITPDDWRTPTGRTIWLGHPDGSPFESRAIPETVAHVKYGIGWQSGTYHKSTQTHDGMVVWWGAGVHPVDLANGWKSHGHPPVGFDRWGQDNTDSPVSA